MRLIECASRLAGGQSCLKPSASSPTPTASCAGSDRRAAGCSRIIHAGDVGYPDILSRFATSRPSPPCGATSTRAPGRWRCRDRKPSTSPATPSTSSTSSTRSTSGITRRHQRRRLRPLAPAVDRASRQRALPQSRQRRPATVSTARDRRPNVSHPRSADGGGDHRAGHRVTCLSPAWVPATSSDSRSTTRALASPFWRPSQAAFPHRWASRGAAESRPRGRDAGLPWRQRRERCRGVVAAWASSWRTL